MSGSTSHWIEPADWYKRRVVFNWRLIGPNSSQSGTDSSVSSAYIWNINFICLEAQRGNFSCQVSFMPVLVLAARICPDGMEATLFATLMSVSNCGSVLGGLIGAGLTQLLGVTKDEFSNLASLIILCNLSSLLPLPLLGLLPQDISGSDSNENADVETKSN